MLEVSAGSAYSAAVLGEIVGEVIAIEQHSELARSAARRLAELDYHHVTVREGDGTLGAPDDAPFDAILVAAGGSDLPEALKEQLAPGGRLVIPVGEHGSQLLCKLTRRRDGSFEREDLGAVAFVPLIGEQGWRDEASRAASDHRPGTSRRKSQPELIAVAAEPLPAFDDPAFGRLFDRFAERRVVLLGEASHGTSEFYQARAAITRPVIEHHGFTIVAVEADCPTPRRLTATSAIAPGATEASCRSSAFRPRCGATPTSRR